MQRRFLFGGVMIVFAGLLMAADKPPTTQPSAGWITSYTKAVELAKESGKPILADFTGSDWCPPCMKLAKQVLDTKAFEEWAADKVVLLKLDFPNRKPQDAATRKQNAELSNKYKIEGYPTVMLISADGKEYSRQVGYGGKPEPWKKELEANLKKATNQK
jgi:protein disulfide-isomerase